MLDYTCTIGSGINLQAGYVVLSLYPYNIIICTVRDTVTLAICTVSVLYDAAGRFFFTAARARCGGRAAGRSGFSTTVLLDNVSWRCPLQCTSTIVQVLYLYSTCTCSL